MTISRTMKEWIVRIALYGRNGCPLPIPAQTARALSLRRLIFWEVEPCVFLTPAGRAWLSRWLDGKETIG
jgi:hypothetical protein